MEPAKPTTACPRWLTPLCPQSPRQTQTTHKLCWAPQREPGQPGPSSSTMAETGTNPEWRPLLPEAGMEAEGRAAILQREEWGAGHRQGPLLGGTGVHSKCLSLWPGVLHGPLQSKRAAPAWARLVRTIPRAKPRASRATADWSPARSPAGGQEPHATCPGTGTDWEAPSPSGFLLYWI